ncbi:pro-neuregulin-1, membrane-bound isoform isoform X2 [Antennarius striatus]|uniref:pro-neuregulin-1, membrane-bound isoform isoform X2 n=1 Tax=Antennarius striatus TaxID=241820 RepID=UPI0035B28EEA
MTEGKEDFSAGPAPPPRSASPTSPTIDTGQVPKEKPEEAAGDSEEEEGAEGTAERDSGNEGEQFGALAIVALPRACCVCIDIEQVSNCVHSEKICILPILACLLSLALCTAGLKWVFVDKIFEYEPPTHLDPKRIGQDPVILSVEPTLGPTVSTPHWPPSTAHSTSTNTFTPGHPEVLVEDKSTRGPHVPQSTRRSQPDPSVTLKYSNGHVTTPKQTAHPQTTQESNSIITTSNSATSSTTSKTSSHVTPCSDSQRNYCVNGGECFTLEIMPGSTKFLCRCPNEFTGDRCQNYVMASFYTEELYQKQILTITGICIALLVVGIMCLVAYCKTKKQRKELQDRLRQSLRKRRNNNTNTGICPNMASSARGCQISNLPLQDLQLMNQCNGTMKQHSADETETTFSTTKYDLSVHEPTSFTNISNQRLRPATSRTSVETPGSPPSETSAPLSSLAVSEPSVALSPSGEEERPLLLSNTHQTQKSASRDESRRTSAHYNHGHVAHSLPPSPLFTMENGTSQLKMFPASPEKRLQTDNIDDCSNKRTGLTNGHVLHDVESMAAGGGVGESQWEHAAFSAAESTTALFLRALYSSRTNPAPSHDDLQVQSSSIQPGPVTV